LVNTPKEKVLDMGDVQMAKDKKHVVIWLPFIDVGVMVLGRTIIVHGKKIIQIEYGLNW
jgi:hypothetical protein